MGQFSSSILSKSNRVPYWLNKVEEVHFMKILSTSHRNHFHVFEFVQPEKYELPSWIRLTWVRDVLGMRCLASELFVVRVVLGTIFFFFFFFFGGGGLFFLMYACIGYELSIIRSHKCICLTHWGRVTHKCVGKLTIIGSDNGLSPGRRQAIIWTSSQHRHAHIAPTIPMSRLNVRAHRRGLVVACHAYKTTF